MCIRDRKYAVLIAPQNLRLIAAWYSFVLLVLVALGSFLFLGFDFLAFPAAYVQVLAFPFLQLLAFVELGFALAIPDNEAMRQVYLIGVSCRPDPVHRWCYPFGTY